MASDVEDTIGFLADQLAARETAIWCGAGISLPAGLPLAYDLMDQILSKTSLDTAEQQRIREFVKANLPFERFMEIVLDTMDDATRVDLLKVFGLGAPAIGHRFLAALVTKKLVRTIYTTNFDTHIESALNDAKLKA
jgi:NAD-dependent SIR2 family protein deacetylase